jgi:hypothetical protein
LFTSHSALPAREIETPPERNAGKPTTCGACRDWVPDSTCSGAAAEACGGGSPPFPWGVIFNIIGCIVSVAGFSDALIAEVASRSARLIIFVAEPSTSMLTTGKD